MKKLILMLFLSSFALNTQATLIDNGIVNGVSTFKAQHDNSIWVKLDAFEAINPDGVYSTFINDLSTAGFSIATGTQVLDMLSNNGFGSPSQSWDSIIDVIGKADSRNDYIGGYISGQRWVSTYSDKNSWGSVAHFTSDSNRFLGVWATYTQSIPEPSSFAMLGLALVGFGFSRRKNKA